MNCEQFEVRWNELLDLRERPHAHPELQEHLRRCGECRSMAAAQEAVFEGIASLRLPPPRADLTDRIIAQVQAAQPVRRWTALKLAAALAAAAAIMVACWPALFLRDARTANRESQIDSRSPVVPEDTAAQDVPQLVSPPIGALAQEASARYQELAREARAWSDISPWLPNLGVSLSEGEPPVLSSSAADWMGELTTGLQPLTQSTSATLKSLLQALPGEASGGPGEERAS
jgi:predicted anti-sigma-YlaC factor YlaD